MEASLKLVTEPRQLLTAVVVKLALTLLFKDTASVLVDVHEKPDVETRLTV